MSEALHDAMGAINGLTCCLCIVGLLAAYVSYKLGAFMGRKM